MYTNWNNDLDQKLKAVFENSTIPDILKIIGDIPWRAICRRARKLGLYRSKEITGYSRAATRGPRKDSCSEAEATLLKEIFEDNSKNFIIEKFKKTGFNRSPQSIFRFARQLGLKRSPELIKQDMIEGGKSAPCPPNKIPWTAEEDNLLRIFYPTSLRNEIEDKLSRRTFKAIRERAVSLGLFRDKKFIDMDRAFHLKKNLNVDSTWQLEKVKNKSRQTNLKKRGVEYPSQSPEVRDKIKQIVRTRYGVDNVFQDKEIQDKAKQSMYKNGTQKCSKQQYYIAQLVKGKINYPIGNCNADILLEDKIICEYDGGGHYLQVTLGSITLEQFNNLERRRELFLKSKGFSTIRIISKTDLLPADDTIIKIISEGLNYLKTGHSWVTYDIDKKEVKNSMFKTYYDYGPLRQI